MLFIFFLQCHLSLSEGFFFFFFCSTHSCRACSSSMAIRSSLISACSCSMVTSSLCAKTSPSTITLGAGGRTAGGVLGRSGLVCLGVKCSATCSESSESQLGPTANTLLPPDRLLANLFLLTGQKLLQTFGKLGAWDFRDDSSGSGSSLGPWDYRRDLQSSSSVILFVSITIYKCFYWMVWGCKIL